MIKMIGLAANSVKPGRQRGDYRNDRTDGHGNRAEGCGQAVTTVRIIVCVSSSRSVNQSIASVTGPNDRLDGWHDDGQQIRRQA